MKKNGKTNDKGEPEAEFVNSIDRKYEPLRYTLINAHGELGWGLDDKK